MRSPVRLGLVALCAALVQLAGAQSREGVYVPAGGSGTPWSLNANHALVWGGQPYLPIGIRIDGTAQAVSAAKTAGFKDVLVDLPASGTGWDETLAALKAADMRYLVRVDSLAPMAKGIAVDPQAYRVAGIEKPQTVTVELPGATSAFVVLASRRDGSIASSGRVPVVNGRLSYEAKPGGDIEHVLLVYPDTSSYEQVDFWENLDSHRDTLLASLKRHAPGAGLRGIVNPFGRTLALPGRELRFVPSSPFFRMELRDQLERKYHSLRTAMQMWGIGTNDLQTFDDLARLVPLWQGSRGVGLLLDPTTNRTYSCDNRHSAAWSDLTEAVNAAGSRRFTRFVAAIRGVTNVPVIQEWAGWAAPYETPTPAIDGVGMRASGTSPSALVESASRAASSVARWSTAGWLPATDIDLGGGAEAAGQLSGVLDDLGSLGARGFFFRTDSPALLKALSAESAKRASDSSLASQSLLAVFFPENARNPAVPQRLTGGRWWLPAPSDGNRVDLGTMFSAYRMRSADGYTIALWAKTPGRYRLRMTNTKGVAFASLNGLDPAPKAAKGGVDVFLSDVPTLVTGTDEVPVPELAFQETVLRFEALMAVAEKSMRDIGEERLFFRDYVNGFDRNPGGSFPQLRAQLDHLATKVGDVTWLEPEKAVDTNFSEAASLPGCSGGGALVLRTPLPPGPDGYFVNLRAPARTSAEQEVWLAAKIPAERRGDFTVTINGQPLLVTGEPVSLYSDGYGWYKLGVTRLAPGDAKIRIQVLGSGAEVAIDAITLSPRPFVPNGVTKPDPIVYPPMPAK